jgi:transposase
VIDVELLPLIRRWHYRDGLSIREIARRLHLSRNTVKKYVRGDVTDPKYPPRRVASKLDPFAERLRGWLKADSLKPKMRIQSYLRCQAKVVSCEAVPQQPDRVRRWTGMRS